MTIVDRARRWLERQGNFRIVAYCAAVGLATLTIAPDPELSFSLSVRREPGRRAEASRCDDCTQPGDFVRASVRGSSGHSGSRIAYGIRAYLDGDPVASCDDCASLRFAIPSIGRYRIVGVQAREDCPLVSGGNQDQDLATMTECGDRLASSSLEAR